LVASKPSHPYVGDFNSKPSSAVRHLLGNGVVHSNHKDILQYCSVDNDDDGDDNDDNNDTDNVYAKLNGACFISSYQVVDGRDPEFTNLTYDFCDCLDYIFFDDVKQNKKIIMFTFRETHSTQS
jgi:mRNA deadenylase 3'-5' endonuclease subunit Ccr4